jgi:hypothetical protein
MGRPLKIAKAVLLTMTGTAASSGLVTVSENLNTMNIIAGMAFTPNVTRGGMTAGTTYYILQVVSANTFTVSATQLSANPDSTPLTLSNSSTTTILTVGAVDTGFNNPDGSNTATNNSSYGAVGGNTGIYGKQTLCNVAFGVAGTGTVFASTSSTIVTGLGTDFANVATGTHMYALWGDGTGSPMLLGTATSTHGPLSVAVANTTVSGSIIGTSGNAQTLVVNSPVVFDASFGSLTAGTTYFVKSVANAAAFTVSLTPGGATKTLTANSSVTANAIQQQVVLAANSANNAVGVTGYGDGFVTALPEAGYILRQKGKTKYLVQGGTTGIIGQAVTANVANTALTPNTMTILATFADSSTGLVQSLSDYNSLVFANGSESNISNASPIIATFGTAYAANTYPGTNPIDGQDSAVSGQPYPIATINNA